MDSHYVDDLIDEDEIPELTEKDFTQMVPFSALPVELQKKLRSLKGAKVVPDPPMEHVRIRLAIDLVNRFKRAYGDDWELRIDQALRHYLVDHPLKAEKALEPEHAKAS